MSLLEGDNYQAIYLNLIWNNPQITTMITSKCIENHPNII